jgi:hypothetical protein
MGREEGEGLGGRRNCGLLEHCSGCGASHEAADVKRFLVVCALVSDPGYDPRQSLAKGLNLALGKAVQSRFCSYSRSRQNGTVKNKNQAKSDSDLGEEGGPTSHPGAKTINAPSTEIKQQHDKRKGPH